MIDITCPRIDGRGYRCGCKTIQYWVSDKARWSYKHPRLSYEPWMTQAHCSKCGLKIEPENNQVEYAERLERERNKAREENARLRKALQRIADCADAPHIDPVGEIRCGLHCGVEDHNCTDRYDGADYGYSCGVERALEWANNEAKHALTTNQPT